MILLRTRDIARFVVGLLIAQLAGTQVLPFSNPSLRSARTPATQQGRTQGAALLSYSDLVRLYEDEHPSEELQVRLTKLLNTPFVSNEASARGVRPLKPLSQPSGRIIRVAEWNIERGLEFDAVKAAFTHDQRFFRRIQMSGGSSKGSQLATVLSQSAELRQADIVVLNEVDWGLKRTGYRTCLHRASAARLSV